MKWIARVVVCVAATTIFASAQSGSGAKFGSRDPHTCRSQKAPATGGPSVAQAIQYFQCDTEEMSGGFLLYLVTNVKIEVGRPRKFSPDSDAFNDADPTELVYPIQGSYVSWQCTAVGQVDGEKGKNCSRMPKPKASGACFKTTFSDWHCHMLDLAANVTETHVLPPTEN